MDPASLSRQELCHWAEKMGYLLPSGRVATPSDLAAAASTPSRRRLCDIIMRCFKDRRYQKKWECSTENEKVSPSYKVETLRTKTEEVEHDIEKLQQKIIQRIEKIRGIEQTAKEIQIKILLFNKIKTRNDLKIDEFQKLRQHIQKISSDTEINHIDAMKFLENNLSATRKDWFNPHLIDETRCKLENENMVGNALWITLINGTEQLDLQCNLQKSEAQKQLALLRTQIDSPINWLNHVAKQQIKTIITNALTLLLRGVGLRKMTDEPYEQNLENIVNIFSCLEHNEVYSSDQLYEDELIYNKWKINCDESQQAYNDTKNKSSIMLSKYHTGIDKSHESGYALNKLLSKFNNKIELNAAEWSSLLQKWSVSTQQHKQLLWCSPLSQLRDIHVAKPANLIRNDFLLENFTLKLAEGLCDAEYMNNYVKELEKKACSESNPDHWRKLIRSLEKNRDLALKLNDINQKINRIIKIFSDQPFANMIPDSFTVSNLTFKEWRLQFNLMCTPRRK